MSMRSLAWLSRTLRGPVLAAAAAHQTVGADEPCWALRPLQLGQQLRRAVHVHRFLRRRSLSDSLKRPTKQYKFSPEEK